MVKGKRNDSRAESILYPLTSYHLPLPSTLLFCGLRPQEGGLQLLQGLCQLAHHDDALLHGLGGVVLLSGLNTRSTKRP